MLNGLLERLLVDAGGGGGEKYADGGATSSQVSEGNWQTSVGLHLEPGQHGESRSSERSQVDLGSDVVGSERAKGEVGGSAAAAELEEEAAARGCIVRDVDLKNSRPS